MIRFWEATELMLCSFLRGGVVDLVLVGVVGGVVSCLVSVVWLTSKASSGTSSSKRASSTSSLPMSMLTFGSAVCLLCFRLRLSRPVD